MPPFSVSAVYLLLLDLFVLIFYDSLAETIKTNSCSFVLHQPEAATTLDRK